MHTAMQCGRFSRNFVPVTPKNIYVYYQKLYLMDPSIQIRIDSILKTKTLLPWLLEDVVLQI